MNARISRIGGVCVLGMTLLWAGGTRANPAAQNANENEPRPLRLMIVRQMHASDLKNETLNAQVQPRKEENGKKVEIARSHRASRSEESGGEGGGGGVAFYPADLTFQEGKVVKHVVSHDIYVNCDASCFGFPGTFLNNLSNSGLIRVVDQYVGEHASHRYTVGQGGIISGYPVNGPLGPDDIVTILYAAASAFGTGYGNIYHLFFAPGIDVCADSALTVCYSPDNPNTWVFCAFHTSVNFPDIGITLLSVQPYANVEVPNVGGCQVNQPSPNPPEVDSQANVLSHELIEAITDPDGDAWWNAYGLGNFGQEIGDECAQAFFSYANTNIGGHVYEIQPEYSNAAHACVFRPTD